MTKNISESFICKRCGTIFIPKDKRNNKYCSISCSAKDSNEKRGEVHTCLWCGNIFKDKSSSAQKCCSREHHFLYRNNLLINNWLNGKWDGSKEKTGEISLTIRNYILQKNNNACERCGWTGVNPYSNKTVIQIHHKDGDYKNNSVENLEVLCPNCHSMTDTNGSLNKKGNGRRIRQRN